MWRDTVCVSIHGHMVDVRVVCACLLLLVVLLCGFYRYPCECVFSFLFHLVVELLGNTVTV